jgi:HSP20 family molecular chaperone IbpA
MSSHDPTSWMWAQACALLEEAERMHRQFFRLSASGLTPAAWEPPVDVFEDEREFIVVVALPGVPIERIEINYESDMLVVRADRGISFAGSSRTLHRLEIPYGAFERRIQVPNARLEAGTSEHVDGCLILRLRKTSRS